MGFSDKINLYMKNSSAFILSSLWEEPGAVLIEAAMNNTFIISSDCPYGPIEFLESGKHGSIYKSNLRNELLRKIFEFINDIKQCKRKESEQRKIVLNILCLDIIFLLKNIKLKLNIFFY